MFVAVLARRGALVAVVAVEEGRPAVAVVRVVAGGAALPTVGRRAVAVDGGPATDARGPVLAAPVPTVVEVDEFKTRRAVVVVAAGLVAVDEATEGRALAVPGAARVAPVGRTVVLAVRAAAPVAGAPTFPVTRGFASAVTLALGFSGGLAVPAALGAGFASAGGGWTSAAGD